MTRRVVSMHAGSRYGQEYSDGDVNAYSDDDYKKYNVRHRRIMGPSLEFLLSICPEPPRLADMKNIHSKYFLFMIKPYKYDRSQPNREPEPINSQSGYVDKWDEYHVRMPCSPSHTRRNGDRQWPVIQQSLSQLKRKCDNRTATVEDLKRTIEYCTERHYNIDCLEHLINEIYTVGQRSYFLSTVLANICVLALQVDIICSQPPPLLRIGSNQSVTMSQKQAASLLACSFFCLFPCGSGHKVKKEYKNFQNPNFNLLYQRGPVHKIEKLKCILHYFERVTTKMPHGVITIRRFGLDEPSMPKWFQSNNGLAPMHITATKSIEDVDCTLQVDFANKYIGGGVLSAGCVQEEIRFTICPEMLVSLLVCEVLEDNECVYLIGCEQYSSYKGYSTTFQYDRDFVDRKPIDNWGRKWSYVVAMDALFFRDPLMQYEMKSVKRELIKAYSGFHTSSLTRDYAFPVTTGNWGCGAFNGNRELKAIIQLAAASQAIRPLIYTCDGDRNFAKAFAEVYDYLIAQRARVRHLYAYLRQYCHDGSYYSFFDFILRTPITQLRL